MKRNLPAHAKNFRGKAKNIPLEETFMLKYQERWIRDKSLIRLMEKSRRVGISYSTSYDLVRSHSLKDARNDTWVSSRDEPTAKLFIQDCRAFTEYFKLAATFLGERVMDEKGNTAHSLRFATNTDINSVASNPDVFAGKGGNVVLDELALRKDPRGVYGIAGPTIDWGGRLSIISTHRGSANYFNELVREVNEKGNPKGISLHRVTLQDALDQCFLWKLQTKLPSGDARLDMDEADYYNYQRNRAPDEETFLQEYMCVPADDNSAFLSFDLIASCEFADAENLITRTETTKDYVGKKGTIRYLLTPNWNARTGQYPLYLGVDIGRDHDLTVLWLMEVVNGVAFTRKVVEMQGVEFERQEMELNEILELANLRRACIDNTGLGKQMAERAQKRYGTYRVEKITFSAPVKEGLAYPVRSSFEDRSLRIPFDDKTRSDLRAIRKETTESGNIRFTGERGTNGHSDRFWALALAMHARGTAVEPSEIKSFTRGGFRFSDKRVREVTV